MKKKFCQAFLMRLYLKSGFCFTAPSRVSVPNPEHNEHKSLLRVFNHKEIYSDALAISVF